MERYGVIVSEYSSVGIGSHYELQFIDYKTGESIYFNGIRDADTKKLQIMESDIPYTHRNGNRRLESKEIIRTDNEEEWQSLLERTRGVSGAINDLDIDYQFLGTNSNSAFFTLMKNNGMSEFLSVIPDSFRWELGHSIDLFEYDEEGDINLHRDESGSLGHQFYQSATDVASAGEQDRTALDVDQAALPSRNVNTDMSI